MLLCTNSGIHSARTGKPRYDMICETMDAIADHGFDAVDVNFSACISTNPLRHEPILDSDNYKERLDMLIKKCAERNLKISSTHLPFAYDYTDFTTQEFEKSHAMCCRALEASDYIGAEWAVMHIVNAKDTINYVKKLFDDTKVSSVGIAIENSPRISLEDVIEAHDVLKSEGYKVGICLDVGHCHICRRFGFDYDDIPKTILQLKNRIKVLHIHDNTGYCDDHLIPFAGKIPWDSVMRALREIGFEGELNFETINDRIPKSLRSAYLSYSEQIGRYLINIFENADISK